MEKNLTTKDVCGADLLSDLTDNSPVDMVLNSGTPDLEVDNFGLVPGKIVNLIGKSFNLLHVKVCISDIYVDALIDTGAVSSLVSSDLVSKMKCEMREANVQYQVFGKATVQALGRVNVPLAIGGIEMKVPDISVFDTKLNNSVSLVLGSDFFKLNNIDINVKDRILVLHQDDGTKCDIHLDQVGNTSRVLRENIPCYLVNDVRIERGHVCKVPIVFAASAGDSCNESMFVLTDNGIDGSLLNKVNVFPGVVDSNVKHIYLSSCEDDVILKKGSKIGSVDSILEVDGEEPDVSFDEWESKIKLDHLNNSQQQQVWDMLSLHKTVFSSGDSDIGLASVTEHHIKLSDKTPIYIRPRRLPQPLAEEIEKQCQELLAADIIEPSNSPWAAPIVPVRKKDGKIRMCIDYRQLNSVTIPDKFPMPNLSDSIFGLHGTKFFTSLDLVRGYYQLPIDEESKELTAFSTPRNHWQFKRLSFGLRNAPAAFQREIQAVLSTFPSNKVVAYIDDILIMGSSFEEHFDLVSKVLQTLQSYSIKVKISKCEFFQSSVEYLGHVVSETGISKTPDYVNRIADYPKPKTVGELREFLGLINFQRKFLPNCSAIQKPLSSMTTGKKSKPLQWSYDMITAFDTLKEEMKVELELAYPDYSSKAEKLQLWVDASGTGAGAYLAQKQGDNNRVIGFASMTFTGTQLNYSTLERELTALRWGIKTFKPFLYGVEFILFTDHQPLVHLNNMKIICSRLARTLEELSEFSFEIRFTPGHLNTAADALSRLECKVPLPDQLSNPSVFPQGLTLDGFPAPGGGDSLFISLFRVLTNLNLCRFPGSVEELRDRLVGDLLNNAAKYNLKLDRNSRRQLRLMLQPGQLPSLDVLLAASHLYNVKVFVYFWGDQPVIYQYDQSCTNVVHLQCLGGIHFNPLIEVRSYKSPDLHQCSVYSVSKTSPNDNHIPRLIDNEDLDHYDSSTCNIVLSDSVSCEHDVGKQPVIYVAVDGLESCALLDTGAEISLISQDCLDKLQAKSKIRVVNERVCDVVGFSQVKYPVTSIAEVKFSIGTYQMSSPHKFAVVSSLALPYCFLLGLDFMSENSICVNFSSLSCSNSEFLTKFGKFNDKSSPSNPIMMCYGVPTSHVVKSNFEGNNLRFVVEGEAETINGLSLLIDDDAIQRIQHRCPILRCLKTRINCGVPTKSWPKKLAEYRRHISNLSIVNDILVYGSNNVVVVPRELIVELALTVHCQFAHIGRDKLRELLFNLCWHPGKGKIISDVCTTCHICQTMKEFSTAIVPPTLKIHSSYPFELMAADCMSLPRNSSGFVGCLVVVDHFSKFVCAVPIRDKRSSTIIKALSSNIFPFLPAIPSSLMTDNGPEFSSHEFVGYVRQSGINHRFTTPYCPTSNGAVERVNKTIQNFLKVLVTEGSGWPENLGSSVITYNSTMHSELGMSPSKFLLTKCHSIRSEPPINPELQEKWKVGHPGFVSFQIADLVLMKVEHKGNLTTNKFLNKYKGPYRIHKVNGNGLTYEVRSESDGSVVRAHHTQLRPYKPTPSYIRESSIYNKLMNDCLDDDNDDVNIDFASGVIEYSDSSESQSCESDGSSDSFSTKASTVEYLESSRLSPLSATIYSDESLLDVEILPCIYDCRGCRFESSLDENPLQFEITEESSPKLVDQSYEVIVSDNDPEVDIESICRKTPSTEMYSLPVLDWDYQTDWKVSSVDSECSFIQEEHIADVNIVPNLSPVNEESFQGFVDDDHVPVRLHEVLENLPAVVDDVAQDDSPDKGVICDSPPNIIRTRSRGRVNIYPNVQTRTIERKYKSRCGLGNLFP